MICGGGVETRESKERLSLNFDDGRKHQFEGGGVRLKAIFARNASIVQHSSRCVYGTYIYTC